jgi:NAD-dependent DNA ligase
MENKLDDLEKILPELLNNPVSYGKKTNIDELVNTLRILAYNYYNTNASLVPDEIFDILKDILKERDPSNKFLTEIGSPISKDKVELPYYMPSLDKIKPTTNAVDKWLKKYEGPYVISDKLDGVSGLLERDDNELKLFTRGDGSKGQDISYLIPYVLPNLKIDDLPDGSAIRGELIISKLNFKNIKDDYSNARNTVAGLVNSKKYSVKVAKLTDFIGYAVINPIYRQERQMKRIKKWNIPLVEYKVVDNVNNDMLSDYLIKRRKESNYEIDGIVVIDSNKAYKVKNKNPTYGFAFKAVLSDQVAEANVVDVIWTPSKHGYLKPKIMIEPLELAGVKITYATAHNAKFIKDHVLGPGSVIKLVRSGDVIPYIMEVIKPAASGEPKMPKIPYKWNKTGVDLIVKDIHGVANDTIRIKQITDFFKVLGVKFISEGIITKLVENGYNTIMKIIQADANKLSEIDGIGNKLVTKIYNNMDESFKIVPLEKLMAASNIFGRGMGSRRIKLVIDAYPDILKKNWTTNTIKSKVKELDGFDNITATQFSNGFYKFVKFYKELEKIVDISHLKNIKKISKDTDKFKDEKIVFTGFRDKELEKFVEDNGGKVSTTVSSNTTLVVYVQQEGKSESSKLKKAKELSIKLMTKDEFIKKYK